MRFWKEPVNGITHLLGVLLGIPALIWMILETYDNTPKLISVIIYGASLILLYSASTAMHLIDGGERINKLLWRLDHAAIYLLIAGTYTPIAYNVLSGTWRWGLLGVVWAMAVIGIIVKLFFVNHGGLPSVIFYVVMGWAGVIVLPEALRLLRPEVAFLIVAGGVTYSVGAVVFALKRPNLHRWFGHHELWHIFCLGGSALHFAAVLLIVG